MRFYRFYLLFLFALVVTVASAQYIEQVELVAVEDATVSSLDPTANYGDNPDLIALPWSANEFDFVLRSMLRFDLPELAEGEELVEARLSLFATSGSTNPGHLGFNDALVTRIDGDWDPTTINWDNQPPVVTSNALFLPRSDGPTQDFVGLDVTELVRDLMAETGSTNNGLRIQLQSESIFRSINFASSDHADPDRHPRLTLSISKPGSTGVATADLNAISAKYGPNPLQDQLSLTLQLPRADHLSLLVYDLAGKEVASLDLGKQPAGLIDLVLPSSDWPTGPLMFRLSSEDGRLSPMQRLIKS